MCEGINDLVGYQATQNGTQQWNAHNALNKPNTERSVIAMTDDCPLCIMSMITLLHRRGWDKAAQVKWQRWCRFPDH